MKTFVYVDAFNLYFGCCKGTPFKWLDISKLCGFLLPGHTVERIKYFTARIHPRPGDPGQPMRQLMYLRALQTLPSIEIHFGHFLTHPTFMPLVHPSPGQNPYAEVFKTEEKGSDVNLATHLIHDAHLNRFEQAVVIAGDPPPRSGRPGETRRVAEGHRRRSEDREGRIEGRGREPDR